MLPGRQGTCTKKGGAKVCEQRTKTLASTPENVFVADGIGRGRTITLRLLMQSALRKIGTILSHRALIFDAKEKLKGEMGEDQGGELCSWLILEKSPDRIGIILRKGRQIGQRA